MILKAIYYIFILLFLNAHIILAQTIDAYPKQGCDSLTVTFTTNDTSASTFQWDFGNGNTATTDTAINLYKNPGKYSVSLVLDNIDTIVAKDLIKVNPTPNAMIYKTDYDTYGTFSLRFRDFTSPSDTFNYLYRWEYGDNSFDTTDVPETEHLYTEAGLYDVSVKMWDEAGCSDSATLYNVEVLDSLFVPNVFTPNNDGVNDIFYIYSNGYTEFTLKVYNRWGNMVYSTTAPVIYWDGKTTSGIELNTGVYYYTLESVSKADNKRKQTGFFHLYK